MNLAAPITDVPDFWNHFSDLSLVLELCSPFPSFADFLFFCSSIIASRSSYDFVSSAPFQLKHLPDPLT